MPTIPSMIKHQQTDHNPAEIVGGDHDPAHTYMVVAGHGFLIDLSRVAGELWDQNNVASCA
jgi:hypothetical protein